MQTWSQPLRQRLFSPAKRNPLAYPVRKLQVVLMLLTGLLSASRLTLAQNSNSYIITSLNSPVQLVMGGSGPTVHFAAINDLGWVASTTSGSRGCYMDTHTAKRDHRECHDT